MSNRKKEALWLITWMLMIVVVCSFVNIQPASVQHTPQERSAHLSMLGPFGLFTHGSGSGFYYRDGWLVTAAHVGQCGDSARITWKDGSSEISAKIVVSDKIDVAFIKVNKELSNVLTKTRKDIQVTREIRCISCPQYWKHVETKGYVFHKRTKHAGGPEHLTAYLDIQLGSSGGGVYQDDRLVGVISALILPQFHTVTMIVPADLVEDEFNRLVKGESNDNQVSKSSGEIEDEHDTLQVTPGGHEGSIKEAELQLLGTSAPN